MRGYALKQGLSLNEHGFSRKLGGKKEEKLDLDLKTEKDIFDYLGLEYKKPEERINGSSVKIKENLKEKEKIFEKINQSSQKTKKNSIKTKKQQTKKTKTPIIMNKENINLFDNYSKMTGQQLRDELSELLNLPKGLKNSGNLKTKAALINKIIQLKKEKGQEKKDIIEQIETVPIIRVEPEKKKQHSKKKKKSPKKNITKRKNLKEDNKNNIMKKKNTKKEIILMMDNFKEKGISFLDTLKKEELESIIKYANKEFHSYVEKNTKVTLTDGEYDIIKEYIESKYPELEVLNEIGADFEKNKVDLPVNMPSMNKIKPTTDAVSDWKKKYKGKYVLSCKLDGVSGLYYSLNGERKLFTRGNGSVGQDVSHLIQYVNGIPDKKDVIVRGEFIITKSNFDNKYKSVFSNARNMVAGVINKKKKDLKAKDIDFISYELIIPDVKPSEQMKLMKEYGFKVVKNSLTEDVDNESLSDTLLDYRNNYEYIIDGVIVSDDNLHERKNKNPDHAFAFKMVLSDQVAEAMVLDVIWTASKSGYLKPRVRITPVNIGGANIEYATGFNGKFIEDNKIGIGATIQIIRSGDVIPYIKGVTIPAEKAKMPDVPFVWTDTHVDIILANKDQDKTVLIKNMTAFFTSLEVESLSEGNVARIIEAGYDSIPKVLKMDVEDFQKVEGFKEKLSKKIYESLKEKIKKASLLKIAAASNKLGRGIGERKLKPILDKYPDFFTSKIEDEERKLNLINVNGIGKENAESIVKNMPEFLEFLRECNLNNKLEYKKEIEIPVTEEIKNHPLYKKKIVMTKVRDKEIIEKIKIYKGELVDNVKIDVFSVITKSKEDKSNKLEKARELGIKIYTPDEFKDNFLNELKN